MQTKSGRRENSRDCARGLLRWSSGVGIPLPVCIHLQDLGLQFEDAQWTAKQSNTGFSISFFWPVHDRYAFGVNLPSKKCKRRHKRARRTSGRTSGSMGRVEGGKEAGPGPSNTDKNETPIVAHQSSQECSHKQQTDLVSSVSSKDDSNHNAEDSAALDLLSCESISYEMRQNIPGGICMKDGYEGWTPVVSRNRRRKKLKQQPISSSDDSDSELDVRGAREVSYQERDGVPYLYVCRGCTSRNVKWTPIAPSPIAFRTRRQIKNSHDVI